MGPTAGTGSITHNTSTARTPAKTQTIILVGHLFLATFTMYLMRTNLSFAIDGPQGMSSQYRKLRIMSSNCITYKRATSGFETCVLAIGSQHHWCRVPTIARLSNPPAFSTLVAIEYPSIWCWGSQQKQARSITAFWVPCTQQWCKI